MPKQYYTYIMTNKYNNVLYTGMTHDLAGRVLQHKERKIKGFTQRYNATKLVYYETFEDVYEAIMREKQIKGWLRVKKVALIEALNPKWEDLGKDWYDEQVSC